MFKKILALALVLSMALFMVPAQAEEAESTFPAIAKEDLKIGMIYVGDTSDGGYNYVHDSALMQAVKELGMNEDQVVKKTNVPEDATCETALRELVEAGCQIIFADSFGHMYYMELHRRGVSRDYLLPLLGLHQQWRKHEQLLRPHLRAALPVRPGRRSAHSDQQDRLCVRYE